MRHDGTHLLGVMLLPATFSFTEGMGGDGFARNEFRGPVGGGLDVGSFEEIGDDDDAPGTGGEDLREGLAGDAADAEGGDFPADFALHGGDVVETDGGAAGLGGGGEKRAEADVVEAFGQGGAGLGEGVGGAADRKVEEIGVEFEI